MYLISIVAAFVLGGLLALLIRAEHMSGTPTIIDADTYNQVFTLHGAVMTFLFIIPGIPAALGNFVLPIMLGAKDVAFPRLNLLSWYLWLFGSCWRSLDRLGGLDTGWTFYTPYSTHHGHGGGPGDAGRVHPRLQLDLHRPELHRDDPQAAAPGMTWFRMPLFLWGPLRHGDHPDPGHAGARHHAAAADRRARLQIGIFDPGSAATRCCTSTSSGSTATRRSTS
jgi:cytochrome c oxidase subunit 1